MWREQHTAKGIWGKPSRHVGLAIRIDEMVSAWRSDVSRVLIGKLLTK